MRKYLFFFFTPLILAGCGQSDHTDEVTQETVDSSYCNCGELVFDEPYNHFWRFERRKGYTGKCEEFYSNGQLKISKIYKDGKLNGKMISYYDNGQIESEKEFDMNFQVGEQIIYTKKGEVKFHALYKRGVQTEVLVNRPDLQAVDPWEE